VLELPIGTRYYYDEALIDRCFWLWEMSGYKVIPDIEQVAAMNELYLNDLLTHGTVIRYAGDIQDEEQALKGEAI
jgi:hypothetical protein